MLDLRMSDMKLEGRSLTLFPAARESGITDNWTLNHLDFLIIAIYEKMEELKTKEDCNPFIIDTISEEYLDNWFYSIHFDLEPLFEADLIVKDFGDSNIRLTQKTKAILNRASDIQAHYVYNSYFRY